MHGVITAVNTGRAKERHQRPQAKSKVPPTAVVTTAAVAIYSLRAVTKCPQTNVGHVFSNR